MSPKKLFATMILDKNAKKSSVIHVKIENLMSDKRLSWMCFQVDFGLVFEVHFGVGCLS